MAESITIDTKAFVVNEGPPMFSAPKKPDPAISQYAVNDAINADRSAVNLLKSFGVYESPFVPMVITWVDKGTKYEFSGIKKGGDQNPMELCSVRKAGVKDPIYQRDDSASGPIIQFERRGPNMGCPTAESAKALAALAHNELFINLELAPDIKTSMVPVDKYAHHLMSSARDAVAPNPGYVSEYASTGGAVKGITVNKSR